jgi:hypothetical protein
LFWTEIFPILASGVAISARLCKEDGIEVEFVAASGRTEALVTLKESDVRPISDTDLIAVRSLHKRSA